MRQFTISLDKETQRPITFLKNWYGLDAMIDTGALFYIERNKKIAIFVLYIGFSYTNNINT